MSDETKSHKRRVRYKGKNPRRFEERYKEHQPERYAGDIERIKAKGNTPAGSHRPICVTEILAVLDPQPGQVCLDATLGYGGHAQELLKRVVPGGRVLATDVDPIELPKTEKRIRALGFDEFTFSARPMNFAAVRGLLHETDGGFDCIVADLGVSSMQLDNPARGFSYKAEGPLDLRLNPKKGQSASEFLQSLSREDLESLLTQYADEPHARHIAYGLTAKRRVLQTTTALAQSIRTSLGELRPKLSDSQIKKSLQRTFMALRIAVNEEFEVLERFLQVLPFCLRPGGRVAILSFHSGEDRRVKKAFARALDEGLYERISSSPTLPTAEECRANPRATCAKLRWAVRSSQEN